MNDLNLIVFNAISNFVNELGQEFRSKHKPLKLYCHLIKKTNLSHDKAILKHIECFRKFCIDNRDGIRSKNMSKLTNNLIKYSSRVYIDFKAVMEMSDKETKQVIWSHILCISALIDPAGKAKEVLRKNMEEGKTGSDETEFLTNIISKVEANVKPDADPMAAVSSIMSSGIFTDLIGGMQNGLQSGKLDIGKLLGAVQGMVSSLGNNIGDDPEAANAMGMLSNMTSMMGNMGNMMAGPNSETKSKVEELDDDEEEEKEEK